MRRRHGHRRDGHRRRRDPRRKDAVAARAQRFGWISLTVAATAGLALEAAHAFKVAAVLDDELARLLLRLAHAHGTGLSLVVLVWSVAAPRRTRATLDAWMIGAILLPLGFALGAIRHPEGDPSIGIVLAPVGALAVAVALARTVAGR